MSKDNKRREQSRILRTGEQQRQDGKFYVCLPWQRQRCTMFSSWKLDSD